MVNFGKSDKMIKISGKVNKSNTYNGLSSNISFFIQGKARCKCLIHPLFHLFLLYIYIYIYVCVCVCVFYIYTFNLFFLSLFLSFFLSRVACSFF